MTDILRMTSRWDGFPGAPGYTNFYSEIQGAVATQAQAMSGEIRTFWNSLNGYLPAVASVLVLPTYQVIDDATGNITAEGDVATPAALVDGNSAAQFAGNSGVLVEWRTGVFIAGRRLKGRTYLVPFIGIFDTDGTVSAGARDAIQDAVDAVWSGAFNMVVWHRPVAGSGGSSALVTSGTVRDRAAVLRTRSI